MSKHVAMCLLVWLTTTGVLWLLEFALLWLVLG